MKKITFIAEAGRLDANGDQIDIDGLFIPHKESRILTQDFNYIHPLGVITKIYKEDGVLKVDAEIWEEVEGYPAISYSVVEETKNMHGGKDIQESILEGISICYTPNPDSQIEKISTQH